VTGRRRVGEELNASLHRLFARDERLFLLGQDIVDPYGGAFGITRGLSTRYPERVIGTPISEAATMGVATGLALCGDRVVVEVMFGDFIALCFDQIVNFASKAVTMYGRRLPVRLAIRCPVGGNRGYGPTHSQSPHKHLLGVPHLSLFELTPFAETADVLARMLALDEPSVLFENKTLYANPVLRDGLVDDLFRYASIDGPAGWIHVYLDAAATDYVVIAPGGLVPRVVAAMRQVLLDHERLGQLFVPSRLYPVDLDPVLPALDACDQIVLVEDDVAGGGWSAEVARLIYDRLYAQLRRPVRLVQPPCAVIPAAPHLEREILVQESTIAYALGGTVDGRDHDT
jgi:pyruvate dehydrogenase E1 component beta subunit